MVDSSWVSLANDSSVARCPMRQMARCLYWALPVLLAAIASGCGGPAEGPSSAGDGAVVPWIDRPAPPYQAPAPRVVPFSTKSPPCRAGQLAVRQLRTGVGLGN